MAFNVGDVVQLKSGGPLMTVANPNATVGGRAAVGCTWFDGKTPQADSFPEATLKLANKPSAGVRVI